MKEISAEVRIYEKEVVGHLEHLERSLHRCPVCRGEVSLEPLFSVGERPKGRVHLKRKKRSASFARRAMFSMPSERSALSSLPRRNSPHFVQAVPLPRPVLWLSHCSRRSRGADCRRRREVRGMRRIVLYLLGVVVMLAVARWGGDGSAAADEASPGIQGAWSWTLRNNLGSVSGTVEFIQEANTLTGMFTDSSGSYPLTGTIDGSSVSFTISPGGGTITFKGSLKAEEAKIAAGAQSSSGQMGMWTATRQ